MGHRAPVVQGREDLRGRAVLQLLNDVIRLTFSLPLGINHVHCYALRTSGGWTIVDAGLGVEDATERWKAELTKLDAPVERIVITHFHPDHVGASSELHVLTGAPVFQGKLDYEQCERTWGKGRSVERLAAYMQEQGLPEEQLDALRMESDALAELVHFVPDPQTLEPGDDVDGWDVLHLPGHADGHLALVRDGVLVAGDALLATISPNVGLYPESRPDPLADYLDSLQRIVELAPRVAFAGHGPTIEDPPARAQELLEHHRERLAETRAAVAAGPRNTYEVSLVLFPEPLGPPLRRFALAETRAHLEYLARRGEVECAAENGRLRYALLH